MLSSLQIGTQPQSNQRMHICTILLGMLVPERVLRMLQANIDAFQSYPLRKSTCCIHRYGSRMTVNVREIFLLWLTKTELQSASVG